LRPYSKFLGSCALVVVASALAASVAAAKAGPWIELRIELPAERFIRGGLDPAEGLEPTLTVSNVSALVLSMPEPRLDPVGGTDFEVYLIGTPYGVPASADTPARTRVKRNPWLQPVGNVGKPPGFTLKPGESKQFRLNVGRNYNFRAAGRYEMSCLYEAEHSNTVAFEVLPLKRVDVIPHMLLMNLDDYERGEPDFPFMFYITQGHGRFDEIVYLMRAGAGVYEHYQYHRLAEVAVGVTPEMVVSGSKVGVLVPDKANEHRSWFFTVDFDPLPIRTTSEEFLHDPGEGPSLTVDASGKIGAR
jgi:hypothetical protein